MAWTVAPAPSDSADAVAVQRAYLEEVVTRYYGRPATDEETDEEFARMPGSDLTPPRGVLLLARARGSGSGQSGHGSENRAAGCAGVRLLSPDTAELKRIWVHPDARTHGLGSMLLTAAEHAAVELGATAVRLDTRHDLVEARRMYARHGYAEIARYHDDPYADHFFEKRLG